MKRAEFLLLLILAACARGEEVAASRPAMGTVLEIRAQADRETLEAAFREVERLDAVMSDWRPETELSRFNAAAGRGPVAVSADLLDVLHLCGRIREETHGAFDATVGPLVLLDRVEPSAPASRRRQRFALVGGEGLSVKGGKASLARPGMAVDLGGIGKGYAADRVRDLLVARGAKSGFIDFGHSTMLGFGPRTWKVALPGQTVELRDTALGTSESGPATFDPRTGKPVPPGRFAAVRHPSAAVADAWGTAIVVLGDEGARLARSRGLTVWYSAGRRPSKQ